MTDRRLEELLPFAANGTLDPEERAELDAALAADARLAAELKFVEALRDEVRAREVTASPGELGLARLRRAIATEAPAAPVAARANWWKVAAVAASALLAVQSAAVLVAPGDVVRLAGGGGVEAPMDSGAGPVLTVAFRADATEAALRQALVAAGVTIVDGPSALGLYRVAPLPGVDAAAAEAALRAAAPVEDVRPE